MDRLCNGLLLGLLVLLLLLLVVLLLGKARFLEENQKFVKGLEAARKKPEASEDDLKKVDPISGVPWGSG